MASLPISNFLFLLTSVHEVRESLTNVSNAVYHGGGRYHIETSPLICRANQWTGFYMITVSAMKELKTLPRITSCKETYKGNL